VGSALATHFGVPYEEIMGWHQQGLGFGGIVKAHSIVEELGGVLTVEDVLNLKLSGIGWGRMSKDLGLSPSSKNRNLGQVMSGRARSDGDVPGETSRAPERDDEPGVEGQSPNTGKAQGKSPPGQDRDKVPPGQGRDRMPPGQDKDRIPPGQDRDRTPPGREDKDKGKGRDKGNRKGGGKP